ncbi:MAG: hypothetical protein KDA42_01270 [Planctomycetales bacterium]|nr:hypothetical protein [Planctomycetales bacterium]
MHRQTSTTCRLPPRHLFARPLLLCILCASTGCGVFAPRTEQVNTDTLLHPASTFDDSVTLEIFFASLPCDFVEQKERLWTLVDEQQIDSKTRRQLVRNGMRAGLVGPQIPDPLAEILQLTEQAPSSQEKQQGVPLEHEPRVAKRLLQLRMGRRGEIIAAPVAKEIPLLLIEHGSVAGRTFREAQPLFATEAQPGDGAHILLTLAPELHHGQPQQQWTGQDGILRLDMTRNRETYEQLRTQAALGPGQMLVVGRAGQSTGNLGYHFFTESAAEGRVEKLLIIRLAQTPAPDVFAEGE